MAFLETEKPIKPLHLALGLFLANLVWRMAWLPVSQGAYTDGILQLSMFDPELGLTYWPPLYPVLSLLFAWVPGVGFEGSARFISVLAGSLAVLPLEAATRRLFGKRAALFAAIAYTLSPMPLRWSVQVMTDATFMAFWTASMAALVIAGQFFWPALYEQADARPEPDASAGERWLLLASLAGALATLTRYQGIFLVPVIGIFALRARGAGKPGRILALAAGPWLLVPVWLLRQGFGVIERHFGQIAERANAASGLDTALNYWYFFEEFVLDSPYFLTYGIFGFFLFGLFRIQFTTVRVRRSVWAGLYLTLALLALHSIFQAFQTRYLLPLVPLVCAVAGHGLAVWERRCADRPARFWALAGPAFAYAIVFSSLVALYQGSPFIDIKRAGKLVRDLPAETRIISTETYNREIGAAKLGFWSGGRQILPFGATVSFEPGDTLVLPSAYGGWRAYQEIKRNLREVYDVEELGQFAYSAYPLLPDIMEEPITHVNPLAWHLRYARQRFETTVLRIKGYGGVSPAAPADEDESSKNETADERR